MLKKGGGAWAVYRFKGGGTWLGKKRRGIFEVGGGDE